MVLVIAHVICTLFSYLAFLTAFVFAILFLIQERQLKQKHMGVLFHRLPSLEILDRVNFFAIGIGFGFLSTGFMFGLMGARALLGHWWRGDPKEYLTLAVWVVYLVLWLMRVRATLRGRRVAMLSILGFSLVVFTFLGVKWMLPTWHAYL